jgi:NhaP-type Na+/H+ or K+/H+ antiporter
VFAAGLALRRADDIHAHSKTPADKPPLTPSMLNVNEQLERIVEVAVVLLVGAMISTGYWSQAGLGLAAILFVVIRPLAVWIGVRGSDTSSAPRRLLAWFGIRGIGSVYYAVFFAGYELRDAVATELLSAVFTVIAASIVVHGISAAPLMELYRARRARARPEVAVSDKQ